MVNSSKTPTGRAKKGEVAVRIDGTSIKACFPRPNFPGENQVKKATGISNIKGWEAKAFLLKQRLQLEMEEGKLSLPGGRFNENRYREILVDQKLIPDLKIVENATLTSDGQLPPKPELSLMEVWDMYCEYRKHDLKESTHEISFKTNYLNFIKSAIEATKSEDALKIRNWLVENRSLVNVKKLISHLSNAYQLAMRHKLISMNPYDGMTEEITIKGAKGKKQNEIETESDDDVLDQAKAYTWDEVQIILEYVETSNKVKHWFNFLKFKFLTGCRTGEAIAFMWCDVLWDKKQILFRRTYDNRLTKSFYPTKTSKGDKELIRVFPMPKDGELWNLLKSIPQGEPNEVVFKSKTGKIIHDTAFGRMWRGSESNRAKGVVSALIEQGKLTKYLSPYNTRHTFITHQVFDLGRDEKIVSAWCGHGEMVSQKHYQDIADRATQINPELPANNNQQVQQQSELDLLKEQLRQHQELINKLLQNGDNLKS